MAKGDLRSDIGPWAIVPEWLQDAVDGNTLKVFARLALMADREGICWPEAKTLAERTNLSMNTVKQALKALQDAGAIEVQARYLPNGQRTSNNYVVRFTDPEVRTQDLGTTQNLGTPQELGHTQDLGTAQKACGGTTQNLGELNHNQRTRTSNTPHSPPSETEKAPKRRREKKPTPPEALAIVELVNELGGRKYSPEAQAVFVMPRLSGGATAAELELVTRYLGAKWLPDDRMKQYFTPEGIFRSTKWDQRLVDAREWDANGRPSLIETDSKGGDEKQWSTMLDNLWEARDQAELSNEHPIWKAFGMWLQACLAKPPQQFRDGSARGLLNIAGMATEWARDLPYEPEVLERAAKSIKSSSRWFPTFPDFREACKTAKLDLQGRSLQVEERQPRPDLEANVIEIGVHRQLPVSDKVRRALDAVKSGGKS